ncbi:MAG: hypothetical protein N2578_10040, partial [Bdellovibrionaceae bacterium]|nr:hypothetical protein [Pseudobdellovibrionaceae bacterium]
PIVYSTRDMLALDGRKMSDFWHDNEFAETHVPNPVDWKSEPPTAQLRWDLVRTQASGGCIRAETLEIRHLLPSDPQRIYEGIVWQVLNQVDRVEDPSSHRRLWVDVNYYVLDPKLKPISRASWVEKHLYNQLGQKKRFADLPDKMDDFLGQSLVFPYRDPAAVEIVLKGDSSQKNQLQGRLNRAGY